VLVLSLLLKVAGNALTVHRMDNEDSLGCCKIVSGSVIVPPPEISDGGQKSGGEQRPTQKRYGVKRPLETVDRFVPETSTVMHYAPTLAESTTDGYALSAGQWLPGVYPAAQAPPAADTPRSPPHHPLLPGRDLQRPSVKDLSWRETAPGTFQAVTPSASSRGAKAAASQYQYHLLKGCSHMQSYGAEKAAARRSSATMTTSSTTTYPTPKWKPTSKAQQYPNQVKPTTLEKDVQKQDKKKERCICY